MAIAGAAVEHDAVRRHCSRTALYPPVFGRSKDEPVTETRGKKIMHELCESLTYFSECLPVFVQSLSSVGLQLFIFFSVYLVTWELSLGCWRPPMNNGQIAC